MNKYEGKPMDGDGVFSFFGTGFTSQNFRSTINGYMYGNGPMMTMKKGEHVRWYMMSIGGIVRAARPTGTGTSSSPRDTARMWSRSRRRR